MNHHNQVLLDRAKLFSKLSGITLYVNRRKTKGNQQTLDIEKEFSEYRTYFVVRNGEVIEDRRETVSYPEQ